MPHKFLIMGLPGAGKTTLAMRLAPLLRAVWFDSDYVREELWPELGFSHDDRVENARRMGRLCNSINVAGYPVVASFVCPTPETRRAFGPATTIWVDRIAISRFADTNDMFVPPTNADLRLVTGSQEQWVERVLWLTRREAA